MAEKILAGFNVMWRNERPQRLMFSLPSSVIKTDLNRTGQSWSERGYWFLPFYPTLPPSSVFTSLPFYLLFSFPVVLFLFIWILGTDSNDLLTELTRVCSEDILTCLIVNKSETSAHKSVIILVLFILSQMRLPPHRLGYIRMLPALQM